MRSKGKFEYFHIENIPSEEHTQAQTIDFQGDNSWSFLQHLSFQKSGKLQEGGFPNSAVKSESKELCSRAIPD
jgi:hypothetical protein